VLHVEKLENRKDSEGKTVEELLAILDLKGVIFTMDALHCKKNAAQNRKGRKSLLSQGKRQSTQTQNGH
jgi:predicted transposase YbfD/YdcC